MTDLTIFGFPQSTYVRTARLTCEEKGVPYALEVMGFSSADLPEVHPFRRIPAARHGDVLLYETSAICRYIDLAFDGPPLVPGDAAGAAAMEQWISVVNAYVDPPLIRAIVMERIVKPMLGQEIDEARCADAVPPARHALSVLDARCAEAPFLAGGKVSLADFFLLPILAYFRRMPEGAELMPSFPALDAWYGLMAERPSFASTAPPPPHKPAGNRNPAG